MDRINFIKTTGITFTFIFISFSLMSSSDANKTALIHIPEEVNAIVNNQNISVKLGK